jgi:hypothetical protein
VACGVTGGGDVDAVARALLRRRVAEGDVRLVPPRAMLETGLPYARSRTAVVLDAALDAVPPRYAEADRAAQLVSVVADAVPRGGTVVVPAAEREVQVRIRQAGRVPAVFSVDGHAGEEGHPPPRAAARVRGGRIAIEADGGARDAGRLDPHAAPEPQLAAALAAWVLEERDG